MQYHTTYFWKGSKKMSKKNMYPYQDENSILDSFLNIFMVPLFITTLIIGVISLSKRLQYITIALFVAIAYYLLLKLYSQGDYQAIISNVQIPLSILIIITGFIYKPEYRKFDKEQYIPGIIFGSIIGIIFGIALGVTFGIITDNIICTILGILVGFTLGYIPGRVIFSK